MHISSKTITSALEELTVEPGISEVTLGGKPKIERKDPVVTSRHHIGDSTAVLLALFGMELAAIWRLRGRSQDVKVNVRNAIRNLAAVLGGTIPRSSSHARRLALGSRSNASRGTHNCSAG